MSAKDAYLNWRKQAAVGCMFARFMSIRSKEFGQKFKEIESSGGPPAVAAAIAACTDEFLADNSISAATFLLPNIVMIEDLLAVALALGAHPSWTVTTTKVQAPPSVDLVAVHIAREIPFGQATCPSEVLVLGPFDHFPPTRRAPITAVEIFVGEPQQNDPKTGTPSIKANLAHVQLGPDISEEQKNSMWEKSIEGRRRSLGGDDNRAKAKVSFVIPASLARDSGCEPS